MNDISMPVQDALEALITRLAAEAHAERKAMVEYARRSLGQRIRWAIVKCKEVEK